jgi:thioredoxin 1
MKTQLRIAIILVVAGLVAGAVALKKGKSPAATASAPPATVAVAQPPAVSTAPQKLPKLVDLGAGKCIPCKKMAPILEELKKKYAGKMEVEFVDVWQNPDAGNKYGIRLIPTQIFYDAAGKELFRHEGFFDREDILGKWKELGVDLADARPAATGREITIAQALADRMKLTP